ncbi:related to ACB 4-hydroxyacetophenone monooxygenase [Ramularia collo-cygni]|uniref:Related to ACB 4-hydroxyacetophenone monooxygenase n=1 Tax=Ramularia collo-cygni TaxID=112498 RepID=A0A2D3UPE9_9PEZI|nr:related to ACB 4-hydroxyacetophenone monooxygenase [Ramularia collo-cygni]CZT14725.1 related to ACB 4-hydroxyacetophenone monooxygenase [Ramularia collo-cygni]
MYSFDGFGIERKSSYGSLIDLSENGKAQSAGGRPRIAIVGAGITGISTACHILDAGLDCHIFESGNESSVGGIWTKVNTTSRLQIHSQFYRFHPAVQWDSDYPNRQEILGQVHQLWDRYNLASRTTFHCPVESTRQEDDGKWVVNDPSYGYFDGVVAAVGTCGEVYAPKIAGQDNFKGRVIHSSELDPEAVKGKNVVIIGGGASAVEALEFSCDNGAASAKVLARSERWFIPREPRLNACLAGTVGDRFGILAWILGFMIRFFFYREFWEMAPPSSGPYTLFSGTPIVNSRIFQLMRQGRASWVRGDVRGFSEHGIEFTRRKGSPKAGELNGEATTEKGDICILATGYSRPSLQFLPQTKSSSKYQPPNWYLQTFPTENATVCATNCTWQEGIGSVGGVHIGLYTRFLLAFVMDPEARPSERFMKGWVDLVHILKKPYPGGALSFVSSAELFFWIVVVIAVQPSLWKWASFILSGPDLLHGKNVAQNTNLSERFPSNASQPALPEKPIAARQDSGISI